MIQKHYVGTDRFRIHQGWNVVKLPSGIPVAGPFRLKLVAVKEAAFLDKWQAREDGGAQAPPHTEGNAI